MKTLILVIISFLSLNLFAAEFWDFKAAPNYKMINIEKAHKQFKPKKDVVVAIIDTGIDANFPLFKDSLVKPKGAHSKSYGVDFSTILTNYSPKDNHGHGTHIAGIIKTLAPKAKFLILKYYDPKASGLVNLNSTVRALRYAVEQDVDIINYSGGGPEASPEEKELLKKAQDKGILVVAAAGNEKSDIDDTKKKHQQYFPANYKLNNIIAVNSHTLDKKLVASSNWGKDSVDIAAPGYQIQSAFYNNQVALMTGTSQATAFVSGVAALIKSENPDFSYAQIKEAIMKGSIAHKNFLGKNLAGGLLDADKALTTAKEMSKKLKNAGRSVAKKKSSL